MPWTPGADGRGKLVPYDFTKYAVPGLSIGFQNGVLDAGQSETFFGDGRDFKPIFAVPGAAGAELTAAAKFLADNDEIVATAGATALVQGYLDYVAATLNVLYLTPTGHSLLNGIGAAGQTVLIVTQVAYMGNSYNGGGLCWVSQQLINERRAGRMDYAGMLKLVKAATGNDDALGACTALANAVNALPLYSLWVQAPAYADPGFLDQFLRFQNAKVTGQVLCAWLTAADAGAFDAFLTGDKSTRDGVSLTGYFVSALIMLLYGRSEPGNGSGATVQFKATINVNDAQDPALTRPPAIGLGHELVHAYNSTVGAQPGVEFGHYSTLLAELICVGLAPFDTIVTIDENALRREWAAVSGQGVCQWDRQNPPPRLVYDAVPADDVLDTRLRASTP